MAGLTTPVSLRSLYTTLRTEFSTMRGEVTTDLDALVMKLPSSSRIDTFAWLGAFPQFREWVGPRAVGGLKQRVYQVLNKDYELTIGVDRNTLDDAQMADARMIVSGMRDEALRLPQDLIFDLLINGHTRVGYDGQYFFDTDHPTDLDNVTGTQSNYDASGAPLNRANFIAARAKMRAFKGENNRPFGVGATGGLVLVVPLALEQAAIDIVSTQNIAVSGGVTNNTLLNAAKVIVVPRLDSVSTTAWYLFDTSGNPKPFLLIERQAPRFVLKDGPTDENLFWHKEYIFGADARYGAGYGAWQKAYKGQP